MPHDLQYKTIGGKIFNMKERRNEFDLIRAVSTVAIVLFHYSYAFVQYDVGGNHVYFMLHSNGTWGAVFVSLFFMLSGASLYYNWNDRLKTLGGKGGVADFYKKRWLSIFPMFYIGWLACYLMYVISFEWLWNWGGPYSKLWLTFFGMDGYFLYRGLNYYTIGEWFLGAIIMLYLLYPLLQWAMNKNPVLFTMLVAALFGINTGRHSIPFLARYNSWVQISDNINIITCLLSFWTGMLLIRIGRKLTTRISAAVSLVLFIIITCIKLPVSTLILSPILAVCAYIMLSYISLILDNHMVKRKTYDKVTGFISRYSYPVFLIHHVTIQKMLTIFTGREMSFFPSLLYFFVTLGVICLLAVILSEIASFILKLPSRMKTAF